MAEPDRAFPEQYMLRMPAGMRDALKARAKANGRSMNVEAVMALEAWLAPRATGSDAPGSKAYDPALGTGGILAAMTDFVQKHPGIRITLDLRPDDEAEPVRTLGPDDKLADVGEVEGGPPYPRHVEGPPPPPDVQAERDRLIAEGRVWKAEQERKSKEAERA